MQTTNKHDNGAGTTEGAQNSRRLGLLPSTAINMTQMCGIGPFITIPLMVGIMGGPQAIFGWIIGAIIVGADGLVWAELGAAMPGAGGTLIYLREAFQYRTGKLMPFLFIWTMMLTIPLLMSTGIIGLVDYLQFFDPNMGWWPAHLIGLAVTGFVIFLLYRRIESIGVITTALWVIMLVTVGVVIIACYSDFNPNLAFDFPEGAFGGQFLLGLSGGLVFGVYDYLGYYTTAYMGNELRDPGRTMPRSILYSIVTIMCVYLALNIGMMGVLPWKEVAATKSFLASIVVQHVWGTVAAGVVTILIVITAFASVFAGLLGGSRIPMQAAHDKLFFSVFGKLHKKHNFPHVALIAMGVVTAAGSFFSLTAVISVLLAAAILVQFIAQIAALVVLRRRQPKLHRPYKQWFYPVPCIIALAGWIFVYSASSAMVLIISGAWIVAGAIAFLIWAKYNEAWPFAPVEIREEYMDGTVE